MAHFTSISVFLCLQVKLLTYMYSNFITKKISLSERMKFCTLMVKILLIFQIDESGLLRYTKMIFETSGNSLIDLDQSFLKSQYI